MSSASRWERRTRIQSNGTLSLEMVHNWNKNECEIEIKTQNWASELLECTLAPNCHVGGSSVSIGLKFNGLLNVIHINSKKLWSRVKTFGLC